MRGSWAISHPTSCRPIVRQGNVCLCPCAASRAGMPQPSGCSQHDLGLLVCACCCSKTLLCTSNNNFTATCHITGQSAHHSMRQSFDTAAATYMHHMQSSACDLLMHHMPCHAHVNSCHLRHSLQTVRTQPAYYSVKHPINQQDLVCRGDTEATTLATCTITSYF